MIKYGFCASVNNRMYVLALCNKYRWYLILLDEKKNIDSHFSRTMTAKRTDRQPDRQPNMEQGTSPPTKQPPILPGGHDDRRCNKGGIKVT